VSSFFKAFEDTWIIFAFGGGVAFALLAYGFWVFNQSTKQ